MGSGRVPILHAFLQQRHAEHFGHDRYNTRHLDRPENKTARDPTLVSWYSKCLCLGGGERQK